MQADNMRLGKRQAVGSKDRQHALEERQLDLLVLKMLGLPFPSHQCERDRRAN